MKAERRPTSEEGHVLSLIHLHNTEASHNVDPVMLYIADYGLGRARVTICCFDRAWTHFWSHMGEQHTGESFLRKCDMGYLVGKFSYSNPHGISKKTRTDEERYLTRIMQAVKDGLLQLAMDEGTISPTGRLNKTEPNMQTVAPKTEEGQKIIDAFRTQLANSGGWTPEDLERMKGVK